MEIRYIKFHYYIYKISLLKFWLLLKYYLYNGLHLGPPPFDFRGTVEIYIDVYTATDTIYLQQEDIIFNPDLISIAVAEDTPVQAPDIDWTGFEVNNTLNLFMLVLDDSMVVGAR